MTPSKAPRRKLSSAARFWVLMGAALIAGLAIGFSQAFFFQDGASPSPAFVGAALLIGFALLLLGTWWWWVRADEAAREAHKWAWYWGGSIGMTLGLIGLVMLSLYAPDAPLPAGASYADALLTGAFGLLFLMLLGYGVAWAAWWISRRR
ncbi:hypothetical protein [Brevundimonas sp.]|uniref:hypothetical protein n=1 Tax=Brevundimonas sp. TaxID=1871086 RepID=UPI0025C2097D|nr:hypothetical protein [Brevundimonas sp.]